MTRTLYITVSTFDFSTVDPNSTLLDKRIENLPAGVYHTSLGDLQIDDIIWFSLQFNNIKFEVTGFDTKSNIYKESLALYQYLSKRSQPIKLDVETFTSHPGINTRLDQPMLWVFGCSNSHGVGLLPGELTYGHWLAQHLDLPLKLITKPGSSLAWSYRHLLNSPIQKDDLIIWQLTSPGRVSRLNGNQTEEIMLSRSNDRVLVDSMNYEQLFFNQISMLNTGTKFLKSVGCKFVVTSFHHFEADYEYVAEYIKYPEYCSNYGTHLDFGTDGLHDGPLSHQALAQRILTHVQLEND